jgi:hypothetical protein
MQHRWQVSGSWVVGGASGPPDSAALAEVWGRGLVHAQVRSGVLNVGARVTASTAEAARTKVEERLSSRCLALGHSCLVDRLGCDVRRVSWLSRRRSFAGALPPVVGDEGEGGGAGVPQPRRPLPPRGPDAVHRPPPHTPVHLVR